MELTKEYFDTVVKKMATKDDLKGFATKDDLKSEVLGLETRLKEDIENKTTEILVFLSERAAHKDDLAGLNTETQTAFQEQNIKLSFMHADLADIRKGLKDLGKRTREDDDALNREIIKVKTKVDTLEKQMKKIRTKLAAQ